MLIEYAEDAWVGLDNAAEFWFALDPDGFPVLHVVRCGGDRFKPEVYVFEKGRWAEYAKKVIRAAAVAAAGEP